MEITMNFFGKVCITNVSKRENLLIIFSVNKKTIPPKAGWLYHEKLKNSYQLLSLIPALKGV